MTFRETHRGLTSITTGTAPGTFDINIGLFKVAGISGNALNKVSEILVLNAGCLLVDESFTSWFVVYKYRIYD